MKFNLKSLLFIGLLLVLPGLVSAADSPSNYWWSSCPSALEGQTCGADYMTGLGPKTCATSAVMTARSSSCTGSGITGYKGTLRCDATCFWNTDTAYCGTLHRSNKQVSQQLTGTNTTYTAPAQTGDVSVCGGCLAGYKVVGTACSMTYDLINDGKWKAYNSIATPASTELPFGGTWTVINTNDLYSSNSGNIGIGTGTTAPSQKLEVAGNIRMAQEGSLTIDNRSNPAFLPTSTYGSETVALQTTIDSRKVSDGFGGIYAGTAARTVLSLQPDFGYVGIGTVSPSAKLDVEVSSGGAATIGSSGNTASGEYAIAMGYNTTAGPGARSTAMGESTIASGQDSFAVGYSAQATGTVSMALGDQVTASGNYSTATGYDTHATGTSSTATGYNTTASGAYSVATGENTTASGIRSTAMGFGTTASAEYATAMGNSTTASAFGSTAMGNGTQASDTYSTAMGFYSKASGTYATAMGYSTASGYGSTAMNSSVASGWYTTSMGDTNAVSYMSTVVGRGNVRNGSSDTWVNSDPLFVVGNGTYGYPNNALTVTKGGAVGIGTESPAYALDVRSGDIIGNWHRSRGATGWYNETYHGGWYMEDSAWIRTYGDKNIYQNTGILRTDGTFQVGPDGNRFLVDGSGNVDALGSLTLGSTNTWYINSRADSSGDLEFIQSVGGGANKWWVSAGTGELWSMGYKLRSDARLKNISGDYTKGLSVIDQLKPTNFIWKSDNNKTMQVGLIAQDVQKVLPEAVSIGSDSDHTLSINPMVITTTLVNAVKELKAENDALKAVICEIKPEAKVCLQ